MKDLGLNSLAKTATSAFIRQFVSGLLQLTTIAIIARVYGPAGNGAYALALLLPSMLVTCLNLGVGPANVYYLASAQFSPRKVLATSIKITVILSVIGMIIGGTIIWLKADELFPEVEHLMLWLALFSFPISLLQKFISSIFQGMQKFREFNVTLLAQPVITLAIVTGLVLFENINLYALIIAYFVGTIVTLLLSSMLLQKHLKGGGKNLTEDYIKKAINYGHKAHLSNIMAFVNYKADIFLVNLLLSPANAGVYVIAVQLSESLWMLSEAVSTVLLPRLSELSSDEDKRLQITPLITRFTLYSTAFFSMVFAFLAYPSIYLIFGTEYLDAYIPLLILLPGIVLTSASRILANDLAARGRPELNMYTSIVVVVCNIIGNILLIPSYGLFGAALATTVAYMLNFLMKLLMYRYITKVPIVNLIVIRNSDLKGLFTFFKKNMRYG